MLQNGAFGFLNTFLQLPGLVRNKLSYSGLQSEFHYLRQKIWKRKEFSVYQFGYYFALLVTVINICSLLAVHVPFLAIGGSFFLFLRFISDAVEFTNLKGEEIEGDGSMVHRSLRLVHLGYMGALTVLVFNCFFNSLWMYFLFNIFSLMMNLVFHILLIKFPNPIISTSSSRATQVTNLAEEHEWTRLYSHPLILQDKYLNKYKAGIMVTQTRAVLPDILDKRRLRKLQKQRRNAKKNKNKITSKRTQHKIHQSPIQTDGVIDDEIHSSKHPGSPNKINKSVNIKL